MVAPTCHILRRQRGQTLSAVPSQYFTRNRHASTMRGLVRTERRHLVTVSWSTRRQRQGLDEDALRAIKSVVLIDKAGLSVRGAMGTPRRTFRLAQLSKQFTHTVPKILQKHADVHGATHDACPVEHMWCARLWCTEQAYLTNAYSSRHSSVIRL